MIGINTEEVLLTVATFDTTHFQTGDYVRFTDMTSTDKEPVIGLIENITTDMACVMTVKGIRYCVNANDVLVRNYVIEKITITVEGEV